MQQLEVQADLTVVGGGLAGVCAAIAAARPGDASRWSTTGRCSAATPAARCASGCAARPRHGIQQLRPRDRDHGRAVRREPVPQPARATRTTGTWCVLDAVRAEPNIDAVPQHRRARGRRDGPADGRRIRSVHRLDDGLGAAHHASTRPVFLDCTGDGLVGHLAGAQLPHRAGRRAIEYDEPWAPEAAGRHHARQHDPLLHEGRRPAGEVRAARPSPRTITDDADPAAPRSSAPATTAATTGGSSGAASSTPSTTTSASATSCRPSIYGHLGLHQELRRSSTRDNMTLEWVGVVPGKREYRRFLGDHVLTQHDILGQTRVRGPGRLRRLVDRPASARGMYAAERGSKHWHADGIYHIPLRSLYSRNVENLLFAGRNISATHVAFGTTRVMATCAVLGRGRRHGAAIALRNGLTPRELARDRFDLDEACADASRCLGPGRRRRRPGEPGPDRDRRPHRPR